MHPVTQHWQRLAVLMLQTLVQLQLQPARSASNSLSCTLTWWPQQGDARAVFSKEHNRPSLAVAASEEIFAARSLSATVFNYAGQAIVDMSSTKRSSSKNRAGIMYATDPPLIKHGAG